MNVTPKNPKAGGLRVAQETLLAPEGGQTRIVSIGFPNESALTAGIKAMLDLIPEGTEEQKAAKEAAKKAIVEGIRANEPCISIGVDPNTGHPNSQDWALLSAHPDRVGGRRVVLGGAYRRLRTGARGQYWQNVVRTPTAIIAAVMKALGYQPTPAPRPVYGNPGGGQYVPAGQQAFYPQSAPGFVPQGGQGEEGTVHEDTGAGQDDFGLHT